MKFFTLLISIFLTCNVLANQKAVTEDGDVVVLNDDGTWAYENKASVEVVPLAMNPNTFTLPNDSDFNFKSNVTQASFWINPKKWSFKKGSPNDAAEYNLSLKGGDLYGMVISEQLEIAIETLADIAFENAQSASKDMQVIHREYRIVNDLKVIYMEMEGTIQGIKFSYFGHYYSDESGSVQFLAYTGSGLVDKYKADIDKLLNGLATQQE